MRAILEFNLDEIDDQYAHRQCIKGKDLAIVLWDFMEFIRTEMKYGNLTPPAYEQMERVQTKILEEFNAKNIDLDELLY
jgi:hypothetical protein